MGEGFFIACFQKKEGEEEEERGRGEQKEEERRVFLLQAEDGIGDLVRARGLGDVYKRQAVYVKP